MVVRIPCVILVTTAHFSHFDRLTGPWDSHLGELGILDDTGEDGASEGSAACAGIQRAGCHA